MVLLVFILGFCLFGYLAGRYAGLTKEIPPSWVPACWVAEFLVGGTSPIKGTLALLLGLGLLLYGYGLGSLAESLAVFAAFLIFSPVPYYGVEVIERRQQVRCREIIFFNALSPLTTRNERRMVEGRLVETGTVVVFYIEPEEFLRITRGNQELRWYFKKFEIAPGLFRANCDNEFLQVFDSLDLYRFVLNPEHQTAVDIFAKCLQPQTRPAAAPSTAHRPPTPAPTPTPGNAAVIAEDKGGDHDGGDVSGGAAETQPQGEESDFVPVETQSASPSEEDSPSVAQVLASNDKVSSNGFKKNSKIVTPGQMTPPPKISKTRNKSVKHMAKNSDLVQVSIQDLNLPQSQEKS